MPDGYSAKERQQILEDTSRRLVEIICADSSKGEQFRKQVLNMTVENLDRTLKSDEAKNEMKAAIIKGVSVALENSEYMNPLLFRSILTMGSVSPILLDAFRKAYALSQNFGAKPGDASIVNIFIDNLSKVLEGDVNPGTAQRGGKRKQYGGVDDNAAANTDTLRSEAKKEGISEQDQKIAEETAAAAGVDTDAELKKNNVSKEDVKNIAAAQKASGVSAGDEIAKAKYAAGVTDDELKMGLEAKAMNDGKKEVGDTGDGKPAPEKKSTSQKANEGVAALGSAAGKAMDWARSLGNNIGPLATSEQMTTGVLLEDLLTGLDYRSTEMEKSIFESLKNAIAKHIESAQSEIVNAVANTMQAASNELSQKMSQSTYTLYVYSALKQNISTLTSAIHKWAHDNKGQNFQFSSISSEAGVARIIDNMIQSLSNPERKQTGGGQKITPRNPNIKRSKKHPLFRRKYTRKYRK